MKKELIASTALFGALSIGVVTQAEEVTTEQIQEAKSAYDTSVVISEELTVQIETQEQVVTSQQNLVNDSQVALEQAQENLKEAEKFLAEATEENIAKAELIVDNAKETVSERESNLETVAADADVLAKETAIKEQESVVARKEATLNQAQSDLEKKQDALTKAQDAEKENKQVISDSQNKIADLTTQIDKADQEVKAAEKAVEVATEKEKDKADQLRQANETLEQAKTTLTEKEAALGQDEKELATAKTETQKAEAAITALEDKYGIKQTITVTDKYVELLKKYSKGIDSTPYFENVVLDVYYQAWKDRLKSLGYEDSFQAPSELAWSNSQENADYDRDYDLARDKYWEDVYNYREPLDQDLRDEAVKINDLNTYLPNDSSDTEVYDTHSLSREVIADLSNFASYLINTVREQFGTIPTAVTSTSVEFADLVTDKIIADNYQGSHYTEALSEISNQLGLTGIGESMYPHRFWFPRMATMEEMRRLVYTNVVGWLTEGISKDTLNFPSQDWGHARHMVGLNNSTSATVEYVGLDFATTGTYFDSFTDDSVRDTERVDTTIIENQYEVYATLLSEAQTNLKTAQTNQASKQTARDNAEKSRDAAKTAITSAEKRIADILSIETELTKAIARQSQANSQYQELDGRLISEKNKLASLQETVEKLAAATQAAQTNVNTANLNVQDRLLEFTTEDSKLSKFKNDLSKAIKQVEEAQKELEVAKLNLSQAEEHLYKLQNAPEILEQAKTALLIAQQDFETKSEQLQKETHHLAILMEELTKANQVVKERKAYYEELLALLQQQELEDKKAEIIRSGRQAQPIYDETGKLVDYVAGGALTNSATIGTQTTVYSRTARNQSGKVLPNTGDVASVLGLVGASLSSFGLVGLKRRRK